MVQIKIPRCLDMLPEYQGGCHVVLVLLTRKSTTSLSGFLGGWCFLGGGYFLSGRCVEVFVESFFDIPDLIGREDDFSFGGDEDVGGDTIEIKLFGKCRLKCVG